MLWTSLQPAANTEQKKRDLKVIYLFFFPCFTLPMLFLTDSELLSDIQVTQSTNQQKHTTQNKQRLSQETFPGGSTWVY